MRKISKIIIATCGHIGTHKFNWQPESERFAIGYRNSTLIFNIATTNFHLNRALFFVENLIFKYGRLFIYGLDKKNDKKFIKRLSNINQAVTTQSWCGGFVTNARAFHGKIINVRKKFSAVLGLSYTHQSYSLPREAQIIKLPSIGVLDSNSKPEIFSYPIPINSISFGATRSIGYLFAVKIFKGIVKRIMTRFKKKNKIQKIKRLKKKSYLIKRYFRKRKKKGRKGKIKKNKVKILRWARRFKRAFFKFRKRIIGAAEKKRKKEYVNRGGEYWLTLEAAFARKAQIDKVRKLPKRKVSKFRIKCDENLKTRRARAFALKFRKKGLLPSRLRNPLHKNKPKRVSYMRMAKKRIKKKTSKRGKRVKKVAKLRHPKVTKRSDWFYRKNKKKKKYRYRPNKFKKWRKKGNKFNSRRKFTKPKKRVITDFERVKIKLNRISKLKAFGKIIDKYSDSKNPRFVFRVLKKAIKVHKIRKIYKFLYKKKKKLLIKRKKKKLLIKRKRKQMGNATYERLRRQIPRNIVTSSEYAMKEQERIKQIKDKKYWHKNKHQNKGKKPQNKKFYF